MVIRREEVDWDAKGNGARCEGGRKGRRMGIGREMDGVEERMGGGMYVYLRGLHEIIDFVFLNIVVVVVAVVVVVVVDVVVVVTFRDAGGDQKKKRVSFPFSNVNMANK